MAHTVLRHSEPRSIGDILEIGSAYDSGRIGGALRRCCIYALWSETVGNTMAAYTSSLRLQGRLLYVEVQSAAARSELSMLRSDIAERMNIRAGSAIIDTIILR